MWFHALRSHSAIFLLHFKRIVVPKGLKVLLLEGAAGSAAEIQPKLEAMDYNARVRTSEAGKNFSFLHYVDKCCNLSVFHRYTITHVGTCKRLQKETSHILLIFSSNPQTRTQKQREKEKKEKRQKKGELEGKRVEGSEIGREGAQGPTRKKEKKPVTVGEDVAVAVAAAEVDEIGGRCE
ncbi:hypothetical protein PIB30_069803 [Stylosanthes scabra]|uniref:Uncharacterized protein n=1 Tax=Stylosanthes scabra TaxID=79078 RepID=A0ABU6YMQ4_9FABA|nr:hypothetical protein [Stylosanthes scabra]